MKPVLFLFGNTTSHRFTAENLNNSGATQTKFTYHVQYNSMKCLSGSANTLCIHTSALVTTIVICSTATTSAGSTESHNARQDDVQTHVELGGI